MPVVRCMIVQLFVLSCVFKPVDGVTRRSKNKIKESREMVSFSGSFRAE